MIKVLYLFFFYFVYGLSEMAIALITITQTLLNLFADGPSRSLQDAGRSLALYVKQIVEYLSYASEEKPFPFSDWPASELNLGSSPHDKSPHDKSRYGKPR